MEILRTKNLTKAFDGIKAVDNLSVSIEKGKITSVVGPNGSGKTTLINTLTGMIPKTKGLVYVSDVKFDKIHSNQISSYGVTRTFQNVRLFEQMTVLDNILVVLTERNVWNAFFERHKELHLNEAEEVLKKVGIWEKRNELAFNLSYGQRKLLEIARAISMKAEIYLLDEPFAGLFKEMVKTVASIVRELREEGKTVILVEHDMDLVRELSDHLIVMDSGKLLAEGKPKEVLDKKEVVEAYLGD